jgi:toxin ParE1/3/4
MNVVWLREASVLLDRHYDYIARENPRAAQHVFKRIIAATEKLGTFPHSGRLGQIPGTRELVVTNLPYIVVYRVSGDTVEVLRVFHAAMNWQSFLQ